MDRAPSAGFNRVRFRGFFSIRAPIARIPLADTGLYAGAGPGGPPEPSLLGGRAWLDRRLDIRRRPAALEAAAADARGVVALDADEVVAGRGEGGVGGGLAVLLDRGRVVDERDLAGTAVLGHHHVQPGPLGAGGRGAAATRSAAGAGTSRGSRTGASPGAGPGTSARTGPGIRSAADRRQRLVTAVVGDEDRERHRLASHARHLERGGQGSGRTLHRLAARIELHHRRGVAHGRVLERLD